MAAPIIHAGHMPSGFCLGVVPVSPFQTAADEINETAIKAVIKIARDMAGRRGLNRERVDWSFAANVLCDLPLMVTAEDLADRITEDLDRLEGVSQ